MDEVEIMRARIHDIADKLAAAVTRTEVTATKLDGVSAQLGRIEDAVTTMARKTEHHTDRLTILETRADESKAAGAKWGAALGAFVAALIGGISAFFGGQK